MHNTYFHIHLAKYRCFIQNSPSPRQLVVAYASVSPLWTPCFWKIFLVFIPSRTYTGNIEHQVQCCFYFRKINLSELLYLSWQHTYVEVFWDFSFKTFWQESRCSIAQTCSFYYTHSMICTTKIVQLHVSHNTSTKKKNFDPVRKPFPAKNNYKNLHLDVGPHNFTS